MNRTHTIPALLLGAMLACAGGAAAQPPQPSRTLAASCANCHGTHGKAVGAMPSIAGLPRDVLAEQLRAFRDGRRDATLMTQLAKGYDDAQIEALAEHFARQPKP